MPWLSQAELEEELTFSFGRTIRKWAMLESALWMYLQALMLSPDQFRVRVVWASLPNWQARRKLLLRLGETYLDATVLPKFRSLIKRCNKLAHHRNLVAHSLFFMRDGKVVFTRDDDRTLDDDKSFDFMSTEEFDPTNVLNWPDDIERLTHDLMTSGADSIWRAVHTTARMHREPPPSHAQQSGPHPGGSSAQP